MNVIVTGASGLLGRAVVAEFKRNSWKVLGLAHTRAKEDLVCIDITDNNAVSKIVREFKPHAIIHCAAEKSPDKIQGNPKAYYNLNVVASEGLAKLADEVKAVFVFISTDYVFRGTDPPYNENDSTDPVNEYGTSKVKAEQAVIKVNPDSCILRIPVLYGGEESVRESAISSLVDIIESTRQVDVSDFEIRYPSHTSDIAVVIYKLVQKKIQDESLNGVFHWCGSEPFTKYGMIRIIAETYGRSLDHVIPIDTAMAGGAPRPKNSQLSCERLETLGIGQHTRFVDGIQEFRKFFRFQD